MRLVIKNLPKDISENQIKDHFSKFGIITDLYLLKDPNGKFKRVCYIGYLPDKTTSTLINKLNNSYFINHKITVEECIPTLRNISDSEERIIKYNKKLYISKLPVIENIEEITKKFQKLREEIEKYEEQNKSKLKEKTKFTFIQYKIKEELEKFGEISKIEFGDNNNLVLEYKNVNDTLKAYKEIFSICGKLVKVTPYKESFNPKIYYNSLFFNFESVIKRTCEQEKLNTNELVDINDKNLATKVALLETNLVNETEKFLRKNFIYLDKLTNKKNKKILIVRNVDVGQVMDLVNCKCKMEVAPSKNLVLLKFKTEEEAYKCYKNINLRRINEMIVYCEYAPLCEDINSKERDGSDDNKNTDRKDPTGNITDNINGHILDNKSIDDHVIDSKNADKLISMEDNTEVLDNKETRNKLLIKNMPFQATKKDIINIFKDKYKIQGIRIPKKRDGTPRGFAFVTFESYKQVLDAIEYFGKSTHLYGRRLVLEIAKE